MAESAEGGNATANSNAASATTDTPSAADDIDEDQFRALQ